MIEEAFPLYWPDGQPRCSSRRDNWSFKVSFWQALQHLRAELVRMGAKEVIVSSSVPLRKDGQPFGDVAEPKDPGVAAYFTHGQRRLVIACDSYTKVRWNMRACGMTVESLRAIQRHGATELLERAFTGFAALPPKGGEVRPWWEVLGVAREATAADVKAAFRRLAALHHPDKGGDQETMSRINRAYEQASTETKR